ncbi:hypothetical protein B0T14DRAFT_265043 [Immersiella caudata]|uniref:Uncharacterized protein n=1 Tax=Immersiella caudata TaxID=314043 RepID=A0AA39WKZ9_9PEZI|nr:hypothetical protein B0T14DRAFT_265043 [Immersiella caudata]
MEAPQHTPRVSEKGHFSNTTGSNAGVKELFPAVDKAVDRDDCDHGCDSCVVRYPNTFKIDEDDDLCDFVSYPSTASTLCHLRYLYPVQSLLLPQTTILQASQYIQRPFMSKFRRNHAIGHNMATSTAQLRNVILIDETPTDAHSLTHAQTPNAQLASLSAPTHAKAKSYLLPNENLDGHMTNRKDPARRLQHQTQPNRWGWASIPGPSHHLTNTKTSLTTLLKFVKGRKR